MRCARILTFVFFLSHSVLEDQQNIRLIRELLQTLYTSLCTLVQRVGKSVLVGNINMWVYRMEAILHWQQQLNNIQITRVSRKAPHQAAASSVQGRDSPARTRFPATTMMADRRVHSSDVVAGPGARVGWGLPARGSLTSGDQGV